MTKKQKVNVLPFLLMGLGLVLIGGVVLLTLLRTPFRNEQISDLSDQSELPQPEISRISIQDAKMAFDQGAAVFIDVRGTEYYNEGHIPSALSIPENEITGRLEDLRSFEWIITYCT